MMCHNPDTFFASGKQGNWIHWPILSVHQRICPPGAKESSQNVCFDLPVHSVQQYARWTWQAPTSRSSRQYSPPSNLPTTYHRQWQWMRKRRIKRNKARSISTGPIHQVLSGTRNGRLSICHSQKQAKPGSALHSPLDHSLSKKSPKKSRFVKSCPGLPARAQNTPLAQSVIFLQFPENAGGIIARRIATQR